MSLVLELLTSHTTIIQHYRIPCFEKSLRPRAILKAALDATMALAPTRKQKVSKQRLVTFFSQRSFSSTLWQRRSAAGCSTYAQKVDAAEVCLKVKCNFKLAGGADGNRNGGVRWSRSRDVYRHFVKNESPTSRLRSPPTYALETHLPILL